MQDLKLLYSVYGLVFFDFLNDKKKRIEGRATLEDYANLKNSYRDYLEFYADFEDLTLARALGAKPKKGKNNKEYFCVNDNFYIGHLFFESLTYSKTGQETIYKIIDIRNKKLKNILDDLEELQEYHKNNKEELEELKKKELQIINKNFIPNYNHFLKEYERYKETNITHFREVFGGVVGTSKDDFFKYLLSNSEPLKNYLKKKLEAFIPLAARHKHTYITGQSGSGKSELIKGLIFSIIKTKKMFLIEPYKQENFILLDPHGDLADDVFNLATREYASDYITTFLLDPFLDYEKTPVINPFDFTGNQTEQDSYTEELLNVFREVLGADFSLNAESLLVPCIATLIRIENSSLYDLQRFMNDEQNQDLVERGKITKNTAHKIFFESAFYSTNLNSTKRAIFLKLQTLLNNRTFSNLTTGKTTVDIEKIMNTGKNLVIKLNKKKMRETITPFGRFIIAKVQSVALARADTPENKRPRTHLIIDEFQNFITPTMEEILTESRKYKLFLTLAHQVITQLEDTKTRDIILSNTNIKIVGRNGQKTLNVLAKEMGVKTEFLETLQIGEFFVRVGKNPAFKMYHQRLKYNFFTRNSFTESKIKQIIKLTYTKPKKYKTPELNYDRKKDYINKIITDKETTQTDTKPQGNHTKEQETTKEEIKPLRKPKFDDF